MSAAMWGAVLGATIAAGLLLVVVRLLVIRRPQLSMRVLPYVRDLTETTGQAVVPAYAVPGGSRFAAPRAVFGPLLQSAALTVERVLGGAQSVRRRLERAGLDKTVHEFRIEQVVWGLIGFSSVAALVVLRLLSGGVDPVAGLLLCLFAGVFGVLLRDNRLSAQATDRERKILTEFPTVAELLALSVAAGESPVGALTRVVQRSRGEMSRDLARVLADVRTGVPIGRAFDGLASRSGLPVVARFAEGIAVAVERGTPLADVLHAQAADVREAGRRALIETGARKEIAMMVPVVFLVLPVTVMFAFWPGLIGLTLVTS